MICSDLILSKCLTWSSFFLSCPYVKRLYRLGPSFLRVFKTSPRSPARFPPPRRSWPTPPSPSTTMLPYLDLLALLPSILTSHVRADAHLGPASANLAPQTTDTFLLHSPHIDQLGNIVGLQVWIQDLEVRNGYSPSGGAFLQMSDAAVHLSNVTILSMYSGSGGPAGGAISGSLSTGSLSNVSFVNCTHENAAGGFYMQDSLGFRVEDVSFINCSSPSSYSAFYSNSWSSVGSSFIFAGNITFRYSNPDSFAGTNSVFGLLTQHTPGANISITSDAQKPSRFIFEDNPGTMIYMATDPTSAIEFEMGELLVSKSTQQVSTSSAIFANVSPTIPTNIIILGEMNVQDIACLTSNGTLNLSVAGNITCTPFPSINSAISSIGNTNITSSRSIVLSGGASGVSFGKTLTTPPSSSSSDTAFHFIANGNIEIRDSVPAVLPAAFVANSGDVFVRATGTFLITNASCSAAALFVRPYAHLNISANAILISDNAGALTAPGVFVSGPTTASNPIFFPFLDMNATQYIHFYRNRGPLAYGGALRLASTSNFSMSAPDISFIGNLAQYGGAIFIDPVHIYAFATASFEDNEANQGCIIAFAASSALPCSYFNVFFSRNNSIVVNAAISVRSGCPYVDNLCLSAPYVPYAPHSNPSTKMSNVGWIVFVSIIGTVFVVALIIGLCCKRKGSNLDCT